MDQITTPEATCIFCGRTEQEVSFNREHIIPQNIGGTLFIDQAVCVNCNSSHGARIDHELLKLPEVLDAFESLNLAHDRNDIINKHYKITAKSDGFELKFGRVDAHGFSFPQQPLPDGSLIVPDDSDVFSPLRRQVRRDRRLKGVGLSEAEIENRVNELRRLYEQTELGNDIQYTALGLTLRKGTTELTVHLSPREKADIHPLIAKIAYEVLFFCWGAAFLGEAWSDLRSDLLAALRNKEPRRVFIMRQNPRKDQYRPLHFIRLEFADKATLIRVVFFDHIEYLLVARRIPEAALTDLARRLEVTDFCFLVYQQELSENRKSFWRVNANGEATCILVI